MGQKVNPNGIRLGINKTWSSRWFSKTNYTKLLHEDLNIKKFVEAKLKSASISKIIIERAAKKLRLTIFSSRPGIIIGKKGSDIENLKNVLTKMSNLQVFLEILTLKRKYNLTLLNLKLNNTSNIDSFFYLFDSYFSSKKIKEKFSIINDNKKR